MVRDGKNADFTTEGELSIVKEIKQALYKRADPTDAIAAGYALEMLNSEYKAQIYFSKPENQLPSYQRR